MEKGSHQTAGLRWKTTFNYSQGDTERDMSFTLKCINIPLGSSVALSTDNPVGPMPPLVLKPVEVSTYPTFIVGVLVKVPAGYTCKISFELYSIVAPEAGSSVTCQAGYSTGIDSNIGPSRTIITASVTTEN